MRDKVPVGVSNAVLRQSMAFGRSAVSVRTLRLRICGTAEASAAVAAPLAVASKPASGESAVRNWVTTPGNASNEEWACWISTAEARGYAVGADGPAAAISFGALPPESCP